MSAGIEQNTLSRVSETPPQTIAPQSIFESYSVDNEVNRLRAESELSPAERTFYLKENLLSYFEEFAAQIKVKKLSGHVRPDGSLYMQGTNVSDMYKRSALMQGQNSREWYEMQGMETILASLSSGEQDRAVWFSAPKIADYGFAFYFAADDYIHELGGRPIREMAIRYDDQLDSGGKTRYLYNSIQDTLCPNNPHLQANSYEDYLLNPLLFRNSQDAENLLFKHIGIDAADVQFSEQFRSELLPLVKEWVNEYTHIVERLRDSGLSPGDDYYDMLKTQAELYFGAMFNTAEVVSRRMQSKNDEKDNAYYDMMRKVDLTDSRLTQEVAQWMWGYQNVHTAIKNGSSCPSIESWNPIGQTNDSFISQMSSGGSLTDSMELSMSSIGKKDKNKLHCTCPWCNKKVWAEIKNKKITCPKCKVSGTYNC